MGNHWRSVSGASTARTSAARRARGGAGSPPLTALAYALMGDAEAVSRGQISRPFTKRRTGNAEKSDLLGDLDLFLAAMFDHFSAGAAARATARRNVRTKLSLEGPLLTWAQWASTSVPSAFVADVEEALTDRRFEDAIGDDRYVHHLVERG